VIADTNLSSTDCVHVFFALVGGKFFPPAFQETSNVRFELGKEALVLGTKCIIGSGTTAAHLVTVDVWWGERQRFEFCHCRNVDVITMLQTYFQRSSKTNHLPGECSAEDQAR
jgi:hypothetical protein